MLYFWIAVTVVFVIIEVATTQLVTIWFALGSVAALLACTLKAELYIQIIVFAVVSTLALVLTRPLVRKLNKKEFSPTNADRNIGKSATVTETIDNIAGTGAVKIDGNVWTARSSDNVVIEKDTIVTVEKIDGVKLIVK
ncbi:MAG: NfeD family protein [Clostridia bacterium]|nr:NfeD family protein [Clostridia bacterium]